MDKSIVSNEGRTESIVYILSTDRFSFFNRLLSEKMKSFSYTKLSQ